MPENSSPFDPAVLRRALAVYQGNATEARVPIGERWSRALPDVSAALHPALEARCSTIESYAYRLGVATMDDLFDEKSAVADLLREFPELDAASARATWLRGLDFARR